MVLEKKKKLEVFFSLNWEKKNKLFKFRSNTRFYTHKKKEYIFNNWWPDHCPVQVADCDTIGNDYL